ncbi:hypothetical protein B0H66DRAFT_186113 [Apodospora peruviana]|uniref:Uncharacterized protein n=1 Tax=Apodospora peruviana TaxID=516989 RepID=A0AAE0IBD8_9PEZI|nr:hypothetical protein B0H66DRAFT_186113 [Apodospora peruviana]
MYRRRLSRESEQNISVHVFVLAAFVPFQITSAIFRKSSETLQSQNSVVTIAGQCPTRCSGHGRTPHEGGTVSGPLGSGLRSGQSRRASIRSRAGPPVLSQPKPNPKQHNSTKGSQLVSRCDCDTVLYCCRTRTSIAAIPSRKNPHVLTDLLELTSRPRVWARVPDGFITSESPGFS